MFKGQGTVSPQSYPTLTENEVHVWFTSLEQPEAASKPLSESLSSDEKERARRFQFNKHRNAYIFARAILRILLANYTGMEASQLLIDNTYHGKPFLVNSTQTQDLNFNLSHSGGFAIYAFTRKRRVGIDLEQIRPISEIEQIAAGNFSPEENRQLREVGESDRLKAFFNCWTRKKDSLKLSVKECHSRWTNSM
jgi:4'-phosphopantetheinyl transferase